ncbi:MAG: hypothetical protein Q7R85_04290 [bacterium]|nr:hypothetical protein [bacterium]
MMGHGGVRKNNITKDLLLALARAGLFTIAAAGSPYFLYNIIKSYFKDGGEELLRKRTRRLRELEKRKVIDIEEFPDGTIEVTLTHLGKTIVRKYNLDTLAIAKPPRWDGFWRVIIYDIPVNHKKASDAFRGRIRALGLYQLQRSVWVYPYECMGELEFLCGIFELNMNRHVLYFKTKEIPKLHTLKEYFDL